MRSENDSPDAATAGARHAADAATRAGMLEDLLVEALECVERDGPGGFERWLAAHPQHASRVRSHVERILRLGLAGDETPRAHPEQLGEFKILEPLGQGGMGVVYRAVQASLGREVALKLIRPDQLLFAGARERFRREVELVASLQHPGIVPVHAVGSEAGVPYFAMELVRGATLHDVITAFAGREPRELDGADFDRAIARQLGEDEAREPAAFFRGTWVEVALRILRDAAEALEHAHRRGVLHRDVKPSNLMLTREGRVLLLDFGLASARGGERLTRTGSAIGSLAYMAPELLAGKPDAQDERCDVYSLGATAFEVLALRLPHESGDPLVLQRLASSGERPKLAARHPQIGWEIETVVATALEPDRARRYPSAALLARDLDNVLAHRPIEARAASRTLRLRRWAQRRPALATAIVLGLLLCAAGPLGWELNRMRTLETLRAAYTRADRDFHTALATIGHVMRDTAFDELEDVPGAQRARLTALDRALELYAGLAQDRKDDVEVLSEGGELHHARGAVLRDLGRTEDGLAEFSSAVDFHRRAVAIDRAAIRRSYLAGSLAALGKALAASDRAQEAFAPYAEALELQRALTAESPGQAEGKLQIARLLLYVVEAHRLLDHPAPDAELDEAHALANEVRAATSQSADAAWTVGRACDEKSWFEKLEGRDAAALEHARCALEGYSRASELAPTSRFYKFDVATGHRVLAERASAAGAFDEADRSSDAALAIVGGLLRDFPDSARYRNFEVEILGGRGMTLLRRGRGAEAREVLLKCADDYEHLLRLDPASCQLARRYAELLSNVANSRINGRVEVEEALENILRAKTLLESCPAEVTETAARTSLRDHLEYNEALALCVLDRPEEAHALIAPRKSAPGTAPFTLRMSADLWNEYLLCLRRAAAPGPERERAEAEAKSRMIQELRLALAAGYADFAELSTTKSLDPFRDDPELAELLRGLADKR